MAALQEDFGSEVLGRAAEGVGLLVDDLREAEVCELEVALLVDEQVLRLQVSASAAGHLYMMSLLCRYSNMSVTWAA